jgi:diaminopropionate ammonia-lyase
MLIANERAVRSLYPADLKAVLNRERAAQSRAWLRAWDGLCDGPTPLWSLPGIARRLNVASVNVKDEGVRSPLGSFKALGAPIALVRLILRLRPSSNVDPKGVLSGRYRALLDDFTVISATDGNHGRALAAAARSAGCRCEIVLHANVSAEREAAIAALGAHVTRIHGDYDESVKEAARLAKAHGWHAVSDTSYEGYVDVPRDVMQGYGTIAAELIEQTGDKPGEECSFTHVFLQGGVGGFAAGISSYLWEYYGHNRPTFVVVEPEQADCLLRSALQGHAAVTHGSVDSVMAGLACGEASPLAWRFLQSGVDYFMTVSDESAVSAMRILAEGSDVDVPIVSGESGAAGLCAATVLRRDAAASLIAGLDDAARILVINTEADTAPSVYERLVGEPGDSVRARQARRLRDDPERALASRSARLPGPAAP